MIKVVKTSVKIDRYGRILIPREVRAQLGLKQGSSIEVRIKGNELILRRVDTELHQRVDDWTKFMETSAPKPFTTETREGDSKWLSQEYCMRKLGL